MSNDFWFKGVALAWDHPDAAGPSPPLPFFTKLLACAFSSLWRARVRV